MKCGVLRAEIAAAIIGVWFTFAPAADAALVERIAALIDGKPLLLSEIRERARPLLVGDKKHTKKQIARIYQDTLNKMIDERLLAKKAKQLDIAVSAEEIDALLKVMAGRNDQTVEVYLDDVQRKSHLSPTAYRASLGRQIIEARVLAQTKEQRRKLILALYKSIGVQVRVRFE